MLPSQNRLKKSSEFSLAYSKGIHLKGKFGQLVVYDRKDNQPSKLGIVISARKGKAAKRNLARRRIREALRGNLMKIGVGKNITYLPWDINFEFAEIKQELDRLCHEIPHNGSH